VACRVGFSPRPSIVVRSPEENSCRLRPLGLPPAEDYKYLMDGHHVFVFIINSCTSYYLLG
jgi:hypothetical protein